MSAVKANIAANLAGQAWQVALVLVCAPLYIRLLGIEAFGIIAFFTLVQTLTQMLDFGLGPTVNREIARLTAGAAPTDRQELQRVVGTVERWYWALGIVLGIVLFLALPGIAAWWLRPDGQHHAELSEAARIFGLFAFAQWPMLFYQNGLMGLQRQVSLNAIQIPFGTLTSLGGVLFIWLGPRSLTALFSWQACALLAQMAALGFCFWRHVGVPRGAARIDSAVFARLWRFSASMGGISLAGMIISHLDKVILSRLLSLESFGYYSLAGTLARGLYVVMMPVFNAYYPRFAGLAMSGDRAAQRASYHSAAQVMAVLSLPLAATIALFPGEIAVLWTRAPGIAAEIAPLATFLVIGNCLNGLMSVPYALQLASGRADISLYTSLVLLVVLVPAIIAATLAHGAVGAAATWACANGLYIAMGLPVTHRYILAGEGWRWLKSDVLPPLLAAAFVVGLGRMMIPGDWSPMIMAPALLSVWIAATAAAALSAAAVRAWIVPTACRLCRVVRP